MIQLTLTIVTPNATPEMDEALKKELRETIQKFVYAKTKKLKFPAPKKTVVNGTIKVVPNVPV